jgi:hypothetical protein
MSASMSLHRVGGLKQEEDWLWPSPIHVLHVDLALASKGYSARNQWEQSDRIRTSG